MKRTITEQKTGKFEAALRKPDFIQSVFEASPMEAYAQEFEEDLIPRWCVFALGPVEADFYYETVQNSYYFNIEKTPKCPLCYTDMYPRDILSHMQKCVDYRMKTSDMFEAQAEAQDSPQSKKKFKFTMITENGGNDADDEKEENDHHHCSDSECSQDCSEDDSEDDLDEHFCVIPVEIAVETSPKVDSETK